jgi:hypothetical protein
MLGTIASLTRSHICVHLTVERSLDDEANAVSRIAGVAE